MSDDRVTVDDIRWRYVLPWLMLLDCPAAAAGMGSLLLSSVGVALTAGGWRAASWAFLGASHDADAATGMTATGLAAIPAAAPVFENSWRQPWQVIASLAEPWRALLSPEAHVGNYAFAVASLLWVLLVWSLIGGALLRIAVERLGRKQRLSIFAAVRHAWQRWMLRLAAPAMPLSAGLMLAAGVALFTIPARWSAASWLVGLWSIFYLPASLGATVFLVGAALGLPLMWAALAVEKECDAFDAFSFSFAYTLQRPLQYLLLAALAALLGWLGWCVVAGVGICTETALGESLRWGLGSTRAVELSFSGGVPESVSDRFAGSALSFWRGLIWLAVYAYGFAYFWYAAGAIYLLLRADLDGQEWTDISLGDDNARRLPLPVVAPLGERPAEEPPAPDAEPSSEPPVP